MSVVIPCRNEQQFIGRCLHSLIAQDYPRGRMEVIIVDGISTDATREIVGQLAREHTEIPIRLLSNPGRIVSSSMNMGIRDARGEFIVRIDAHSIYEPDYVRRCVELLKEGRAENVGGRQRAVGVDYLTKAIAIAMTTPYGAGNAYYRYSETERYVDTVYLGAWRKETLEKLGGFGEDWVVNQDYEMNYRLRLAGGRILLSPRIKSTYYVRPSLRKLLRQYFRYGKWKVKTLRSYPASVVWRQIVAPLLVLSLLVSALVLPFWPPGGCIVPAIYLVTSLLVSLVVSMRRGLRYFPVLPLVFLCLHFAWGAGFWAGIVEARACGKNTRPGVRVM